MSIGKKAVRSNKSNDIVSNAGLDNKEVLNKLFYGDNLEVLRKYIKDESIDLCYIDPPFNSKRNYNQIYNNIGKEDKAQAQAFVDTWTWDDEAIKGFEEININYGGKFSKQTIQLMVGLEKVLGKGSLLAYLISMTLRVVEIHRILRPTGSFYLHCDPSASHYLKIVIDSIFCSGKGEYLNEIIWKRAETVKGNFGQGTKHFDTNTDTIFLYSKTSDQNLFHQAFKKYTEDYIAKFYKYKEPNGRRYRLISMTGPGGASKGNPSYEVMGVTRYWRYSKAKMQELISKGLVVQTNPNTVPQKKQYLDEGKGVAIQSLWDDIHALHATDSERLGYPTQKPEALLERIINTSSDEGGSVLDAYCGCGTSIAVAEKLGRKWIGIDITYQSISLILKRLTDSYGKKILNGIELNGIPQDIDSAIALANKKDDRTRKEFEKWSVLTYSDNRAIINEKKGADGGIDGVAFINDLEDNGVDKCIKQILFSVKSDKKPHVSYIRDLNGTMQREGAVMGYFITLYPPTSDMLQEAKKLGKYKNSLFGKDYDRIKIITAEQILKGEIFDVPKTQEISVVKSAKLKEDKRTQGKLELE